MRNVTPLRLVGHPLHAGAWDRPALERLAKARHYDGSVGAEVALAQLECELAGWWGDGKGERSATDRAVIRGLIASIQAVALVAHREPQLPSGWRNA